MATAALWIGILASYPMAGFSQNANLAAAYAFEENSGTTIQDASGNGNTGTLINGPTHAAGQYGNGIYFDGSNDHIRVDDSASLDIGPAGTMEAWVRRDVIGSADGVISKGSSSSRSAQNYSLRVTGSNTVECILGTGSSNQRLASRTTLTSTTQFYHLACTWDGTRIRIYINGTQDRSTSQSLTPLGNTSPLYIGQLGSSSSRFKGIIDEVRIYSRALSATEISQDMNGGGSGGPPDTTAPIISDVSASGITTSAATITWTTDEAANSQVDYGTDSSYGSQTTLNSSLVISHSVALPGLSGGATYHYRVRSTDASGNPAMSDDFSFTTPTPDATPPNVLITGPTGGATVSNTVSVTATASDNMGVIGVQFLLDGSSLGAEVTAAPYQYLWNTLTALNGSHSLTAVARDAAGNKTTSAPVSVTVANAAISGTVAAYAMSEGSGSTTADVSGNNNNGTLSGPAWTASGKYGAAISFDGSNDYVNVNDSNSLDVTAGVTMEAWIYPTVLTGWRTVVLKQTSGNLVYALYANTNANVPQVEVWVGGQNVAAGGAAKLPLNTWSHLAGVYDGAAVQLYVNGTLVRSTPASGSIATSTGPFRIGGNSIWVEYFGGRIDEVRVYSRGLGQAEIQNDMNTPVGAAPDTTPPNISGVSVSYPNSFSAAITWDTNEPSDSQVEWGPDSSYGSQSALDTNRVTAHSAVLSGLSPATTYSYRVRSRDAAGNLAVSPNYTLTTPVVDVSSPLIMINAPLDGATVTGNVSISASASDDVAVAGVQFAVDGVNLGAEDTAATPDYDAFWNSQNASNGSHTISARAWDAAGNQTTATIIVESFNAVDLAAPVLSSVNAVNITTSSALITWTTDEAADSQVQYGTTKSYASSSPINGTLVTSHSLQLTGLSSNTRYHMRVRSRDAAQNLATSTDFTFITSGSASGTIDTHSVVMDSNRRILPWNTPQNTAYDQIMKLHVNFLVSGVPTNSSTGLKLYYIASYFDSDTLQPSSWVHNPAGLFAMFVDSALAYYPYSQDMRIIDLAKAVLDYHLQFGMTSPNDHWAKVPYASADGGDTIYSGASYGNSSGRGDGQGVIEPDKVGELGYAYLKMYEFTGDTRYRDQAIQCANMLASHVRTGSSTSSPWPFRVYAADNSVREDYTVDVIGPIRLLDELIRLNLGTVANYQSARQTAWNWLMTYPMVNNVWSNYFEDVEIQSNLSNTNQYVAMETARYLLLHPEFDSNWRTHVAGIIDWVESVFGSPRFGALAIGEQAGYNYVMASHTSRYASVLALWYEKTGDLIAKEKAYRAFNWATYLTRSNGVAITGLDAGLDSQTWFSDCYGDLIRHFMAGFASVPEWTPPSENHLLGSTAVIRSVSYLAGEINYQTFDSSSTEVLHLNFVPSRVTANGVDLAQRSDLSQPGWMFDGASGVLRIYHTNSTVIEVTN